jgi:hypothetical protein
LAAVGHKVLKDPSIIRDPYAADSERKSGSHRDGVGIGGGWGKDDAVDLGIRRYRNIDCASNVIGDAKFRGRSHDAVI